MSVRPSCDEIAPSAFPRTRYLGSKRKIVGSIIERLQQHEFQTVLDAFGGTGVVSYALKCAGKDVTYNDILKFNEQVGIALIENDCVTLSPQEAAEIVEADSLSSGDFVQRTFPGIYFTDEENAWLDRAVVAFKSIACRYKRALAWFALIQSAIAKRPYNLFHRRNLYMRTADVERSFGNKASWDRSFASHFTSFVAEASAAVVGTGRPCRAICQDALEIEGEFDLVYVDTPYVNRKGVGVDYRDFYHFLEGLVGYEQWPEMVDYRSKHRRLLKAADPWSDQKSCHEMFRRLFERFSDSMLAVSYRSDGIPSIDELASIMGEFKPKVDVVDFKGHQYALSTQRTTREMLLLGWG